MELRQAAEKMIALLTVDGDPASIMVPQQIVDDGPDAVNRFTQAFDDLAKAAALQREIDYDRAPAKPGDEI